MDLHTTKDSVELECCTLSMLNSRIILVTFKNDFELDLEDAKELRDAYLNLTEGRKFLALVDVRNIGGSMTAMASEYFARDNQQMVPYL